MKKLDQKGFAISAILYTMLILTVLLMFLIVGILANRRATLNKLSSEVRKKLEGKVGETSGDILPENSVYKKMTEGDKISSSTISTLTPPVSGGSSYPIVTLNENGKYFIEGNPQIYYYRGAVIDNYVLFQGYCWQIVRTTENQGVKMIYSGKATNGKCQAQKWDLVVGGADSKVQYVDIKNKLTEFYNNNLKTVEYKLETLKVCNSGDNAWVRILAGRPNLDACNIQSQDRIGLLTADEAMYAGAFYPNGNKVRLDHFLRIDQITPGTSSYPNINFATMSYGTKDDISNGIIYIGGEGQLDVGNSTGNWSKYGIRPVIVLKAEVEFTGGNGTASIPYVVE